MGIAGQESALFWLVAITLGYKSIELLAAGFKLVQAFRRAERTLTASFRARKELVGRIRSRQIDGVWKFRRLYRKVLVLQQNYPTVLLGILLAVFFVLGMAQIMFPDRGRYGDSVVVFAVTALMSAVSASVAWITERFRLFLE